MALLPSPLDSRGGSHCARSYARAAGLRKQVSADGKDMRDVAEQCEEALPALPGCRQAEHPLRMKPCELELSIVGKGMVAFMDWKQQEPASMPMLVSASAVGMLALVVLSEVFFS